MPPVTGCSRSTGGAAAGSASFPRSSGPRTWNRTVTEQFTRHGPVVAVDQRRHLAYAVRTAWPQPGMSPYYDSLKFLTAYNFSQFTAAMRNWGAPTENQVYADIGGNIGWVPGGLAPKRRGYDGLLPVPGDGRYEWTGFSFRR